MPALLDLLGVEPGAEGRGMMGRNLLNTTLNQCVLADGTVFGEAGPEDARRCAEGPAIADLLIRGDYFN